MPLYELLGIVRAGKISEVKDIARTLGGTILSTGGILRGLTNWGVFLLPRPISLHTTKHHVGHHFLMRFDASAEGRKKVMQLMKVDPRVLRYGCVKLGSKLSEIRDVPGEVEWGVGFRGNKDEVPKWAREAGQAVVAGRGRESGLGTRRGGRGPETDGKSLWDKLTIEPLDQEDGKEIRGEVRGEVRNEGLGNEGLRI